MFASRDDRFNGDVTAINVYRDNDGITETEISLGRNLNYLIIPAKNSSARVISQ